MAANSFHAQTTAASAMPHAAIAVPSVYAAAMQRLSATNDVDTNARPMPSLAVYPRDANGTAAATPSAAASAPSGEATDSNGAVIDQGRSPKKRERTDSLRTLLPPPDAQRIKQEGAPDESAAKAPHGGNAPNDVNTSDQQPPVTPTTHVQARLMMKDRKGSNLNGASRANIIQNAVKEAPPAKEKSNPRRWSKHEDESLRQAVLRSGERNWKAIADQVPGRNHTQCLQRWTKVLKPGLIKGHWTPEEDLKLRELVAEGKKNWGQVAQLIPGRTSKQCRERWCNHLDPNINKGTYTEEEDKIIVEMQAKLGNRWSIIAQQLKGRTEDAVKIRWKSLMRGKRATTKNGEKSPSSSSSSKSKSAKTTPTKSKSRAASPIAKREPPPHLSLVVSTTPDEKPPLASQKSSPATNSTSKSVPTMATSPGSVGSSLQNLSIKSEAMSPAHNPSSLTTNVTGENVVQPQMIFTVNGQYGAALGAPQRSTQTQPQYSIPPDLGFSAPVNFQPKYIDPNNAPTKAAMQITPQMNQAAGLPPPVLTSTSRPLLASPPQGFSQSIPNAAYSSVVHVPTTSYSAAPVPAQISVIQAAQVLSTPARGTHRVQSSGGMDLTQLSPESKADTPKEEWGGSQTPRSQMVVTDGHASAFELFHQQRLRLMLKERERQGLSLSSAPSPGQAMLTKELKANKERQKRQAILQRGWKSAVEAMMCFNNELPTGEDQSDGLLEKVSLSALDPTDDVFIGDSVDMIAVDDGVTENPAK